MKNVSLLRSYVRRVILEGASDSPYSRLAVIVRSEGDITAYVYDPEHIVTLRRGAKEVDIGVAAQDSVRGYVVIDKPPRGGPNLSILPCAEAWQIKASWARNKGDGRMIYGLAAALSPTQKIMPDRGSVSPAARAGWASAASKGFPSQPLDAVEHRETEEPYHDRAGRSIVPHPNHTDDPSDDCWVHHDPVLDRAYENPERSRWVGELNSMYDNHAAAMARLRGEGIDADRVARAIRFAASESFNSWI
jgi:hypothetical protein